MRFTTRLYSATAWKGTITGKLGELTKRYANLPEAYIQRTAEQVIFHFLYSLAINCCSNLDMTLYYHILSKQNLFGVLIFICFAFFNVRLAIVFYMISTSIYGLSLCVELLCISCSVVA